MQRLARAASRQAMQAFAPRFHHSWLPTRAKQPGEFCTNPLPGSYWASAMPMDFCTQGGSDPSQSQATELALSPSTEVTKVEESDTSINSQLELDTQGDLAMDDEVVIDRYEKTRRVPSLMDYDSDDTEVDPYYSDDMETLNLLDRGEGEPPLPLYKAREMIDFHMSKQRFDGIEVIADPSVEESLKEMVVDEVDEFVRNIHALLRAEEKQKKAKVKGGQKNLGKGGNDPEVKLASGETPSAAGEETEINNAGDSSNSGMVASKTEEVQVEKVEDTLDDGIIASKIEEVEINRVGNAPIDGTTVSEIEEVPREAGDVLQTDVEGTSKVGEHSEVRKEITMGPEGKDGNDMGAVERDATMPNEDMTAEETEDDSDETVGVVEFGKRLKAAYEEEEKKSLEAEGEQKRPTLRWETRLVLGPGGAWHPANRKVKVSVYVRELCLSKHAKLRLLALVGKRYNPNKDELTIVSERFQHRFENQKDVMRILKDLIEEARNADVLVEDARAKLMVETKQLAAGGLAQAAAGFPDEMQSPVAS